MKAKILILIFLLIPLFILADNKEATLLYKKAIKIEKNSKEDAFQHYSKALSISDPSWKKRKDCLMKRGILLYDANKIIESLYDFSKVLELDPNNPKVLKYSAKCLFHLGNFSEAINALDQIQKDIKDPEMHFLKARIYLMIHQNGNNTLNVNLLKSAVEAFSKAIEQNKKYYQAYFHRGRTFMILQAFDEAKKDFESALKYKEDYDSAWFELGKMHLSQKQHFESIDALKKCIEFNAKHYEALKLILGLSNEYSLKDNLDKYLQIALLHYPKDSAFRYLNSIYKIVPENTLPIIPVDNNSTKQNSTSVIKNKEEPKEIKSMWLSINDDEDIAEEQTDNNKIDFLPPTKEKEKSNKTPQFNDANWY